MNLKPQFIAAFIIGGFITAAVLWVIIPTAPEPIFWGNLSDPEISEQLQSLEHDGVVDYQQWLIDRPLSTKYIVPAYIANAPNQDAAMKLVNQEYPEFSGSEGAGLLQEIQQQPIKYREFVDAQKAVYKFFRNR